MLVIWGLPAICGLLCSKSDTVYDMECPRRTWPQRWHNPKKTWTLSGEFSARQAQSKVVKIKKNLDFSYWAWSTPWGHVLTLYTLVRTDSCTTIFYLSLECLNNETQTLVKALRAPSPALLKTSTLLTTSWAVVRRLFSTDYFCIRLSREKIAKVEAKLPPEDWNNNNSNVWPKYVFLHCWRCFINNCVNFWIGWKYFVHCGFDQKYQFWKWQFWTRAWKKPRI